MPHPLDKYREKYTIWNNDQVLLLTNGEVDELVDLIKAKMPAYSVMRWCGHCVGEMFHLAFKLYDNEPDSDGRV